MRMKTMKSCLAAILAITTMACSTGISAQAALTATLPEGATVTSTASTSSVAFTASAGFEEGAYAEWSAVSGATGYNVYVDGTQIDSMLIRQYPSCFRADAVGLKSGSHTLKVVPIIGGKEDTSKAAETKVTSTAHDRSGFGWVGGTSSGAYNEDGTLRSGAVVLYVTEQTKDTVSLDVVTSSKGATTASTGIQNILTSYQKGYDERPLCIRCIGNITDPSTLMDGDLLIKGNGASKRLSCGVTIEGIGTDTVFNGFGLRIANASNVEVRNIGFMNCDSGEGDDVGLQQNNDHVWVHHCDMFYGNAGTDADQVKGDGALDTKTSSYITHSYNHFWDNGKCNLQGMKSESTENYITYHHNWYDHSDSRHPRIRTCTVHIYNNYYDGNAKYGVGVTMGASAFVENNYFRNCKYPMLISMQGSDIAYGTGTFSSENGGVIKAFGNFMTGQKDYVTYQQNATEFDAYEASSRNEKVPSVVTAKQGGTSYNNFDTDSSLMYSYTPDKAEDVPAKVTANAGRLQGGDFKWTFDNSVDDESYAVNQALKDALVAYKGTIVAIGSGFTDSTTEAPSTTATTAATTAATTTTTKTTTTTQTPVSYSDTIYVSPTGTGSGKSESDPTDVLTAIKNVPAGGVIYLLEGTYKYSEAIIIDQNNSGTAGSYKTISAYNGANVVFDFSGEAVSNTSYGFVLDGSYWHFYGFTVTKAGDNGMLLSGNNNIVEMMVFDNNQDTGLQISRYRGSAATVAEWPTNNLVKNCTSKNNCDDATMENADGFAAKLTCGEGNVFDGCFSYNNSDDGWDLYAKTETGPIGVVTLKNCISFRNGFTEDGRGYGNCDGNGFKLGGGGVGTRHIVENCLAFENLNCGFTDNNNPEFGEMKNCTAYNNNLSGSDKANFKIYRNSPTATFENLFSYTSTANVSKTNAPGIKAANDKIVGTLTNGIYYNSKYYYAKTATTMENGSKLGDVVTPADSDFVTLTVGAMGTDFHTTWRNADGTPNPKGFAETPTNGTYASLGYHMSGGVAQETPSTTATAKQTDTPATTTTTKTQTVSGDTVLNFTENENSSFFNVTGNMNSKDVSVSYNGETLTKSLKMESATSITFESTGGNLTLVIDQALKSIKVNGTKYTADENGVVTVPVAAGTVEITKGDAVNLVLIAYAAGEAADTQPSTTAPEEQTTTTTVPTPTPTVTKGDVNGDEEVDIRDVIMVNQAIFGKITLTDPQNAAADLNGDGMPDATDSLNIMKYIVKLVDSLDNV